MIVTMVTSIRLLHGTVRGCTSVTIATNFDVSIKMVQNSCHSFPLFSFTKFTMPPVICNCTICSTKTTFINGVEQPGQYVDGSTRLKHEKQDKRPVSQLAKGKQQSSSPSPSPKCSRASNSPTGKC
jgi:hypothetical protein